MSQLGSSLDTAKTRMLSDIRDRVRQDPSLTARRRQEELSALKRAAAVLGRDQEELPATSVLARRLVEVCPYRHGIQPRRWDNILSLVRASVARYAPARSRREIQPLTPAWQDVSSLAAEKFERARVSRFMHYCSSTGTEPQDVGPETFEAFSAYLHSSLWKDPDEAFRVAVRNWNRCVNTVPGWPPYRPPAPPSRQHTWTLPWSSNPELSASKDLWLSEFDGRDPLGDKPALRPRTIRSMDYMLREAASALVLQGWEGRLSRVEDVASLDAFKAVLRYMVNRRDGTVGGHLVQVAWMLKGIATHVAKAPQADLDEMRAVIRRLEGKLRTQQPGMTRTNRNRLRPFDDPETVQLLLRLPGQLVRKALRIRASPSGRPTRRAARLMMMALAVELLLMAPVRISNLTSLDINRHIVRLSDNQVWLVIAGEEVKNEQDLDYPLPEPTIELLDLYWKSYWPILATRSTSALFPSSRSEFRRPGDFGQAIARTIKVYTGLTINPHLFRHIGAKLYLDSNPGAYEVVRQVLGHGSADTTRRFYTGMETPAAIRHYHAAILQLRGTGAEA